MPRNFRVKKEEMKYNLRLPPEIYEALRAEAEKNNRSINAEINHLLKRCIGDSEEKKLELPSNTAKKDSLSTDNV